MALRYVRQQLSPRPFLLFPERCCADEEWAPHPAPMVRILSFTVQLSDPAEYEGVVKSRGPEYGFIECEAT